MKTILSLKRMTMLLIVILMGANHSFGTVYKLSWVDSYYEGIFIYQQTVNFTYNSSNPTKITIDRTVTYDDGTPYLPKTTFEITGVKTEIVDNAYINYKNEFMPTYYDWRDSEKGILFTKDREAVCLLYFNTLKDSQCLELWWPNPQEKETGIKFTNVGDSHLRIKKAPDMKTYNALLAEVERTSANQKVYRLIWKETYDLGSIIKKFTYDPAYPTTLKIVLESYDSYGKDVIFETSGVEAQVVDGDYIVNELCRLCDFSPIFIHADRGIEFTKDGRAVCLLYYDSSSGNDCLKMVSPRKNFINEDNHFTGRSRDNLKIHPDMSVYNALLAEVERTSSAGSSAQKPAPTTTQKPAPDNTPLSANVYYPHYIIKEPGADALFPFQIFYEVKSTRPIERYDFLCLQNADTGQLYSDPTTGSQYFSQSGSNEPLLTLNIEPEQMPAATPSKPIRVRMWIFMSTPGSKEWIGQFSTPVYTWDGTYLRQERK